MFFRGIIRCGIRDPGHVGCGIKIKPENPEQAVNDIARALEKLYSDKELRISLGKAAQEKADKKEDKK